MAEGTGVKFTLTIWRNFVPSRPLAINTQEDGRQLFDSDSGLQEQVYCWPLREDAFAGVFDNKCRKDLHDQLVNRLADSIPPSERSLDVLREFIATSEKVIDEGKVNCVQSESRIEENAVDEEHDQVEVNSLLALTIHLKWVVSCFGGHPGISVLGSMNTQGDFNLLTPSQASFLAGNVFGVDGECELSVSEERAFKGKWLSLGKIELVASDLDAASCMKLAQNGAFEWQLPDLSKVVTDAGKLLDLNSNNEDSSRRLSRVMDEVVSIATRIGLVHPKFDPAALEQMPFNRSTTVVIDTSGILQGALDFVVRFLHPAARVKIPSIAQMEIANQADRFLSTRRTGSDKPNRRILELSEHLKSQGGQRALLRVELRGDTEVERTYLLGDPLRLAFKRDTGADVSDLDISTPNRSYADRLILEAARHHQAQSGPAHIVRLLTGDQGLARMAMAEGVRPIYFSAGRAEEVFGRRLSGQILDPFFGRIRGVPLTTLVWELATGFGSARLRSNQSEFQVFCDRRATVLGTVSCRARPSLVQTDAVGLDYSQTEWDTGRAGPGHYYCQEEEEGGFTSGEGAFGQPRVRTSSFRR